MCSLSLCLSILAQTQSSQIRSSQCQDLSVVGVAGCLYVLITPRWMTEWVSFIKETSCRAMYSSVTHWIKYQHPAEEVDCFMGRLARQRVENRERWLQKEEQDTIKHSEYSKSKYSAPCQDREGTRCLLRWAWTKVLTAHLFVRPSEDVSPSSFTRRPHRLHRRSPQQVSD